MKKPNYFIYTVLFSLLAAALILPPPPALAEDDVVLKVRPGLGGIFKVEQPLELILAVENPGREFQGVVTVKPDRERQDKYNPGTAMYTMEVKVPAGAREQFSMVIPGELAAQRPEVELLAGGQVLARSRVEGAAVGGGRVILALSEEIMGSGLQAWLSKTPGPQNNLKFLTPGELPASPVPLGAADVIMIDAAGVPALTESQGRALKEWVYLGGTLMLFGGAGAGEGEVFSDVSPVLVTGKKTVEGRLGGLRNGGPLNVATGELVAGKAVVREGGTPVLARRQLGRGLVFFCGAAPGDLGSGAQGLWPAMFGTAPGLENVIPPPGRISQAFLASQDVLTDASAYIPRLAGPPIPVLALLWTVYAAAVGPLLYFLLRRKDRRDLAWLLVPLGSLLVAGFFYFLAPANRLQNYLTQTLATVEIFSPELAEVRAGASVVASRGGDLIVEAKKDVYLAPSRSDGHNLGTTVTGQGDGSLGVEFKEVEYGSLRKVFAYGLNRNPGSIEGRLVLERNIVKGELVNKTGLDLLNSSLLLGSRMIRLGDLPAGGTVRIEEALEDWERLLQPAGLLPEINRPDDPYFRERRMLSRFEPGDTGLWEGIRFLGWHDGAPGLIQVGGGKGRSEDQGLLLIKQRIDLALAGGKFTIPAGFITPRQVESDRIVYHEQAVKEIHGGGFNLLYDLEDAGLGGNFQVESLVFSFNPEQVPYKAEIYSPSRDRWEPLPTGEKRITAEELSGYLADNKVLLKIIPSGDVVGPYPAWPGLAVEGVVTQ